MYYSIYHYLDELSYRAVLEINPIDGGEKQEAAVIVKE